MKPLTDKDRTDLAKLCQKFVTDNDIFYRNEVFQEWVEERATQLILDITNIIGFADQQKND